MVGSPSTSSRSARARGDPSAVVQAEHRRGHAGGHAQRLGRSEASRNEQPQFSVQARTVGHAERTEMAVGVRTGQNRHASSVHRLHRSQSGIKVAGWDRVELTAEVIQPGPRQAAGDPTVGRQVGAGLLAGERGQQAQRRGQECPSRTERLDQIGRARAVDEQVREPVGTGGQRLPGRLDGQRVGDHHAVAVVCGGHRCLDDALLDDGDVLAERLASLDEHLDVVGTFRDPFVDEAGGVVGPGDRRQLRVVQVAVAGSGARQVPSDPSRTTGHPRCRSVRRRRDEPPPSFAGTRTSHR